ncbi:MAG TPA: amino acid permease, partial [Ferruginibacter sp.]|nr:amino acid permease [Ferruginibacter sp.]
MTEQTAAFKPTLGLLDSTMIVAGSMIGSGIFIVSADITRHVGSAGWLIMVWLITGFMTLTAALSYGELSAMFPKAGGQYVYLKEAFNPLAGFLYGWSFFAVIQTATIAAVGVAFSKFAAYLIPALSEKNILADLGFVQISAAQLVAILLIILLTYINSRGIQNGKIIQTVFTATKLLSLFGLIVFGFILAAKSEIWNANWTDAFSMKGWDADTKSWGEVLGAGMVGAVAASMVGSIFSSDAWNNVTFIAGEIENPKRNVPLALALGVIGVTVLYMLANLAYLCILPFWGEASGADVLSKGIQHATQDRVGTAALTAMLGLGGGVIMAVIIMISTFGCNNGLVLSGARLYRSMATDGLFFDKMKELNTNGVPGFALWVQFIWCSVLCLSGKYGDLLDYVMFAVMLFYILTVAGIFILRKKRPEIERPYKAFGYPYLPILYMVMAALFTVNLLFTKPQFTI